MKREEFESGAPFQYLSKWYKFEADHDTPSEGSLAQYTGNYWEYIANVDSVTDEGFSFFTFVLNVEVRGFLRFDRIKEPQNKFPFI